MRFEPMNATYLNIEDVCLFEPETFVNERGLFRIPYWREILRKVVGEQVSFVQENHAVSLNAGEVRGLHYQSLPHAQGELVSCIAAVVQDVIVAVRKASVTYGETLSVQLSQKSEAQLWILPAFLHGYISLEGNTEFSHKVTSCYNSDTEGAIFGIILIWILIGKLTLVTLLFRIRTWMHKVSLIL